MVKQYRLTLTPNEKVMGGKQLGYYFYGCLMEKTPKNLGADCHENKFTPIRQYIYEKDGVFIWVVSLFGEAIAVLEPLLVEGSQWQLTRAQILFTCTAVSCSPLLSAESFFELPEKKIQKKLVFHSPTTFKSQKKYHNLPSSHFIFQSLLRKWNDAFPDSPIEDEDGEGLASLVHGVHFRGFQLEEQKYPLKNQTISGFQGHIALDLKLSGFHLTLAQVLLEFSHYSGVGIKTSLGMGGCAYQ